MKGDQSERLWMISAKERSVSLHSGFFARSGRMSKRIGSNHRTHRKRTPKPAQSYKQLRFGVPRRARRCSKVTHQPPFMPPEDWFPPKEELTEDYRVIVREPGNGYRHLVTENEVRERLALLPAHHLLDLDVVCFSGITRKKSRYPLYGMQWGTTIYLYPMDASLVENFTRPPTPAQQVEARMFGATWSHPEPGLWQLVWTEEQLRDFYLNNVLIHELGHLLDVRNRNTADRERYAEWFAIHYGYRPSRTAQGKPRKRKPRRRHHQN